MTEQRTPPIRIPQLEVLRVLATAGIFLFHLWSVVPLSSTAGVAGLFLERLPFLGALGVIIFNIITGFVLSIPYLGADLDRPIPPARDFFRQRFSRICLHYYPTLVLWTIPVGVLSAYEQGTLHVLLAFVAHVVFVHTLSPSTFFAIVPAFWWLGMLAQFYLVCPWLLHLYKRLGSGKACMLACVLPWLAWAWLTHLALQVPGSTLALVHYLLYFNLPVRLPEFAIGMWLAFAWNSHLPIVRCQPRDTASVAPVTTVLRPVLVGLAFFLLINSAVLTQLARPFDHLYLVCWSVLAVLVIFRWSLASQLGSRRFILELAATSYGIYLLHQPMLGYANQLLGNSLSPVSRFFCLLLGIGLLCYGAAVALNFLVYRAFQQ